MIAAKRGEGADVFARLTEKARRLAEARAEARFRRRRDDPRRWRLARLLWPLGER